LFLFISYASEAQTAGLQATQIAGIVDEELPPVGVRYYYYPNLDAYFDAHTNLYIFEKEGQWIKDKELSSGYRGYSIFNGVRVPIDDYNGDAPYSQIKEHRQKFPKKYSAKRQPPKQEKEDSKLALN
ncbi:MAG TPA: hypothetical protein VGB43_08655, partial [Flavobacterium sp.]